MHNPETQQEQRWEHDKAEVLGWLLYEHPEFVEAQAEQAIILEGYTEKCTQQTDAIENRMYQLENGDSDPLTLEDRLNALSHRKCMIVFESAVEVTNIQRKMAPELIDRSNQILIIPETVYDSNPQLYKEDSADKLMSDTTTVEDCSIRLSEISGPLAVFQEQLGTIHRWSESKTYIDHAHVDRIRANVTAAIGYVFGERSLYIKELNDEFDQLNMDRYSEYTPEAYVQALRDLTVKWEAKVLEVEQHNQATIASILGPIA